MSEINKSYVRLYLRFFLAACLSMAVWWQFSYPQLSIINLSIHRNTALQIAEAFLAKEQKINPKDYLHAIVFKDASGADQYLQKSLGYDKEIAFLKEHDLEFFFWKIRFFKENEKEQYFVVVSAATGEVTAFSHNIKDTDAKPFVSKDAARKKAIKFLAKRFGFDPAKYTLSGDNTNKLDNRTDYSFSWEKNGVYVPWSPEPDTGGAKLYISVVIAGGEALSFNKLSMRIPNEFNRFMARQQNTGQNLALIFRIVYLSLLTSAIFFVVVRRNNLVLHSVKRFCVGLTLFLFMLNLLSYFNDYEGILYGYSTTVSFSQYFWRHLINLTLNTFIVTISILMPSLSGESLHYEAFHEKREGRFLHYLRSSFFSRQVANAVVIGYFAAFIMIGIQSLAFEIGQNYLGVWIQYAWLTQNSSSYLPFVTAFVVSFSASTIEEISFRVFSISLGKKFIKNTVAAVFIASLMWGYGHSTYLVFPMWFRGLEVTCLGLFLSFIYLRYGIISVLVAHYLFDVFWSCSAYLFGKSTPFDLYTSILVLIIPIFWGIAAYILNRPNVERPLRWRLNKHQIYNMDVLRNFLRDKKIGTGKEKEQLQREIVSHGWDQAVVEITLADLEEKKSETAP